MWTMRPISSGDVRNAAEAVVYMIIKQNAGGGI
jgi:hypothetical protein